MWKSGLEMAKKQSERGGRKARCRCLTVIVSKPKVITHLFITFVPLNRGCVASVEGMSFHKNCMNFYIILLELRIWGAGNVNPLLPSVRHSR